MRLFICILFSITSYISYANYHVSEDSYTWTQANNYCISECGSILATIHSESDQTNIIQILSNTETNVSVHVWIGLQYNETSNEWKWSDSSSLDYVYDTSLTYHSEENCVAIDTDTYLWTTTNCENEYQCVCNSCSEFTDSSSILSHPVLITILFILVTSAILITCVYITKLQNKHKLKKKMASKFVAHLTINNNDDETENEPEPKTIDKSTNGVVIEIQRETTKNDNVRNETGSTEGATTTTDLKINQNATYLTVNNNKKSNQYTPSVSSIGSTDKRSLDAIFDDVMDETKKSKQTVNDLKINNKNAKHSKNSFNQFSPSVSSVNSYAFDGAMDIKPAPAKINKNATHLTVTNHNNRKQMISPSVSSMNSYAFDGVMDVNTSYDGDEAVEIEVKQKEEEVLEDLLDDVIIIDIEDNNAEKQSAQNQMKDVVDDDDDTSDSEVP